jgi:hypothetical protein
MKHGISDEEWNEYLDGGATAATRDRIEAHIAGCVSCWEFHGRMSAVTRALGEAAEEARHALPLDDPQLHRMLRGVFAEIRNGEASLAPQSDVQQQLDSLETVMAPYCGPRAATRVLHTAARHSPARSLGAVTHANWEPFLRRLTAIAAAMCGDTFASLVWERGQLSRAHSIVV